MLLKQLSLSDFRNNDGTPICFSDGTNIIYGDNGAGKTNILEAIFCFAAGKSFRGSRDREMICFGKNQATASIDYENVNGAQNLSVLFEKNGRKKIKRNGIQITKLSEYFGSFRAVIFFPEHLELVKGAPEQRRRFIDIAISQSFPRYVAVLNEYNRVLLQKNALLRSEIRHKEELAVVYNESLSQIGAVISAKRKSFFEELSDYARQMYETISESRERLSFRYNTQCEGNSAEEMKLSYSRQLSERLAQEIQRQCSLVGAHKDDFTVYINDKEARQYASQGQQRSAVLSMKLAEGEMSQKVTGEYPVFLLDDIMSELDERRKHCITERLSGKQVIITGCELNGDSAQGLFFAKSGHIERVK
ncbi:MAG TPA: DNA replication/repair protein RecF [Bacillota bacterium]|nr:DNA replication/repair protein RecF [Bacillota bacterium]